MANKLKTNYCDLSDIKIAYTQNGDGKTIMLLHGNSGSKKTFKHYQNEHFTSFQTFALDSRGHGQSISTDEQYSIEQYSNDVINFCNKNQIVNAFVVGYSDGGNIALFLAKKAPEIFTKIVAISPNYLVSGTEEKTLRIFQHIYKDFLFLNKIGINMKKPIMRFELMLKDIGLSENDLKSIKANIKFIYAENDMIKEDHIISISNLIPNSKIEKIRKCTHLNIVDQPETINSIIGYFKG